MHLDGAVTWLISTEYAPLPHFGNKCGDCIENLYYGFSNIRVMLYSLASQSKINKAGCDEYANRAIVLGLNFAL